MHGLLLLARTWDSSSQNWILKSSSSLVIDSLLIMICGGQAAKLRPYSLSSLPVYRVDQTVHWVLNQKLGPWSLSVAVYGRHMQNTRQLWASSSLDMVVALPRVMPFMLISSGVYDKLLLPKSGVRRKNLLRGCWTHDLNLCCSWNALSCTALLHRSSLIIVRNISQSGNDPCQQAWLNGIIKLPVTY